MLVTLICEDYLYDVVLPEKVRGKFWIEDTDSKLLSIEEQLGIWTIHANRKIKLYEFENRQEVDQLRLQSGKMYVVEWNTGKRGYIFAEEFTEDRCTYCKYTVKDNCNINIGSSEGNQLIIKNPYVSQIHAQISYYDGDWYVLDNNSSNGVYVNKVRVQKKQKLNPGDVIYILGVKIIVGAQFIAFNNPDHAVEIHTDQLLKYQNEPIMEYQEPEAVSEKIYYRSPVFEKSIVPLELTIDAPTAQEQDDSSPLFLVLGPSLIMGAASFSSAILTVMNTINNDGNIINSVPSLIMSVSMLAGMVVFPVFIRKNDKKRALKREEIRRNKYHKYLENIREEINKSIIVQKDILNEKYLPVLYQINKKNFYDMLLWNRVKGRDNFLTIRVGEGNVPLQANLKFPQQRFSIDDDVMRDEVNKLSEETPMITNVPVSYSMIKHRVSGIVGDTAAVETMLHNILLQIAALHSYDELKIVFLCEKTDLKKYSYVKWMHHIWNNDFTMRYLGTDSEELRDLSALFSKIIEEQKIEKKESVHAKGPHYLIVSTSKQLSDGCAFLADILADETLMGFSYLAVYDELKNLPKECTAVIQLKGTQGMLFDYQEDGRQTNFSMDMVSAEDAVQTVMDIAEYRLDLQGGKYVLPKMLTFLDMYKVGKYEHLNIASRWKTSNVVRSLQAPVGVNTDGELFYLDLHENAHGPHGLIAGMTGSGKSEFIITYLLSLAVNYSPEDVAFILIDYKGGGLVGAFDNEQYHLPHLSGTITNLDGAAITRSLLSIQSELRRRQQLFNEARNISAEGTMDIYKYQKLYRDGILKTPLPHLFIVADEFAELKVQEPEFMDQLISTARIGRSLGVHLILATQKPGGVVNDQIWANSKFKVCLKVQDKADSMEMLKRPDAAELVETGRFYLQVGYNELFELGQSAWCGAPYIPSDNTEPEADEWVQMIDHQGNIVEETRPQRKYSSVAAKKKQIVEIAKYLAEIAEEEHKTARPLWLPEIPALITVKELEDKYGYVADMSLNPVIGEEDIPYDQEQKLLTLPLTEKGNVICYGIAGSGKELFVTTVLYSLYQHHGSRQLNTYILDFGAETLRMFEKAPQTGGVLIAGEDERIRNLFKYLKKEITRRKKLLSETGIDYLTSKQRTDFEFADIVVIVNNYTNFIEQYEELEDTLNSLTRDCTKYGIYFVVTCISQSGIRFRLQQNFSQVFVLQQNDKSDYTAILGNTGGVYPSLLKGRGIYQNVDVREFQTAHINREGNTADEIRKFCKKLTEQDHGQAVKIRVLPDILYCTEFMDREISFDRMPVGIYKETMNPAFLNMRKEGIMPVFAMEMQDLKGFMEGMIELLCQSSECDVYVLDPLHLIESDKLKEDRHIVNDLEGTVIKLFAETVERHNSFKTDAIKFEHSGYANTVVFLLGLQKIKAQLSNDGQEKLQLILDKTKGHFKQSYFVADSYHFANQYAFETWCNGNGIWVGKGLSEQSVLHLSGNISSSRTANYTDGCLIRQGSGKQMKLVISDYVKEEEDDE